MELAHYLRVLRRRWRLFAGCVLGSALAAGILAATSTPMYEAHAQLFVASGAPRGDVDQTYEGGLLAQQRARSYAELVSSPAVAGAIVDRLRLRDSPAEVQRQLSAAVPVDTVLIDVTARAPSARRAQALAGGVAAELPRFAGSLEGTGAPPRLSVASRPQLPADPASPRSAIYLALGLLLGLALGVAAALLRDALDDRIRTDEQAGAVAALPIVASGVDPSAAGLDGYRRLRANMSGPAAADGARVLVAGAAAEPDSTRVVAGLGMAFAEAGRSVVLVDANLWRPQLGALLGIPAADGLAEVLLDGLDVEDALQRLEDQPRIEVLPAGGPVLPASDVLGDRRLAGVLDALAARAGVVIVNAPALGRATDAAVLAPVATAVLVVARLGSTRARELDAAVRELRAVGAELAGLVTVRPARARGPARRHDSGTAAVAATAAVGGAR